MNERQRLAARPPETSGGPGGAGLDDVRERAERMLAAGAEVIRAALSRDSESFLDETRQQGGQ